MTCLRRRHSANSTPHTACPYKFYTPLRFLVPPISPCRVRRGSGDVFEFLAKNGPAVTSVAHCSAAERCPISPSLPMFCGKLSQRLNSVLLTEALKGPPRPAMGVS